MSTADQDANISARLLVRYQRCRPKYRLRWLENKGAILVVIWSFLVNNVYHFMAHNSNTLLLSSNEAKQTPFPTAVVLFCTAFFFPVGGWLADSYLGRHKTIRYSTWLMWFTLIVIMVCYMLDKFVIGEHIVSDKIKIAVDALLYVLLGLAFGGFQANIVQLGIDQLTDASSTEITSFITSYVMTFFTSGMAFHFIGSCAIGKQNALLMMLYVAVCLTLAVCVDFIFESSLVKERLPITTNSVSLIAKVTRYMIRNRYRSLGETDRSVFDVAKRNYGGPFENQHVEHVKIFFRMMFVVAIGSVVGSQVIILCYALGELQLRFADWNGNNCYEQSTIQFSSFVVGTMMILLYELVIYPLFNRSLPRVSTLDVGLAGMFILLLRTVAALGLETGVFLEQSSLNSSMIGFKSCLHNHSEKIHFSSLWLIILGSLEGLYTLLLILSGYTFLWSQAPSNMKGLVIGIMYASLGLGTMLQSAISAPFLFVHTPWRQVVLSCGIWYYTMQALIVLVMAALFKLMAKRYKRSQRAEVFLNSMSDSLIRSRMQ